MTKTFVLDLVERAAATFLGAALTFLVADGTDLLSITVWQSAAGAGATAASVMVLGLLTKTFGSDTDSASVR
jgi:hypothetical protein